MAVTAHDAFENSGQQQRWGQQIEKRLDDLETVNRIRADLERAGHVISPALGAWAKDVALFLEHLTDGSFGAEWGAARRTARDLLQRWKEPLL